MTAMQVGHRERLFLVVRHVDERDADLAVNSLQLELHLLPELDVESPERLVEEQDRRLVDQGAGERHALLLAAGKLVGPAAVEAAEPHLVERLATVRRISAVGSAFTRRPKATFSETDRCGKSA